MGSLRPTILRLIDLHGPMSISTYMSTLLTSKSTGYYMKKDVFGRSGDFITAPEISQLFGEIIGVNLASKLLSEGTSNRSFHIIELGPGRGTLMTDLLRTFSTFPAIFQKLKRCSFVEMSPILKKIQSDSISRWRENIDFEWAETVDALSVKDDEIPILVAQEFFDAIPIHVFKKESGSWKELKVASSSDSNLCLVEENSSLVSLFKLENNFKSISDGTTIELSPSSWSICHQISKIFDRCSRGEGIIIDYGNFYPARNSLRAIYKHEFCSIFDNIGDADLSVDVDFQSLVHYLGPKNKYNFVDQGKFLIANGIKERSLKLSEVSDSVEKDLSRLISNDQMGSVYKVLEFSRK